MIGKKNWKAYYHWCKYQQPSSGESGTKYSPSVAPTICKLELPTQNCAFCLRLVICHKSRHHLRWHASFESIKDPISFSVLFLLPDDRAFLHFCRFCFHYQHCFM